MINTIKNINTTGYWPVEAKVFCNLFQKDIDIISQCEDSQYIQACADYLNSLDDKLIDNLCLACIRYCNAYLNFMEKKPIEFPSNREVLKMIYPSSLMIDESNESNEPLIHMELNCDWEIEHGMEWIIRGDKILYVGEFVSFDPWDDFSIKESGNYA